MKPKVAWFSPLPPQRTDIANYTERLRTAMDCVFEVQYFTEGPEGFTEVASGKKYRCDLGHFPFELASVLNRCDLPIYHLGNNPRFHGHTWFLSRAKPGLLVLHDRKLHEFIFSLCHQLNADGDAYERLMRQCYGACSSDAAQAAWHGEVSLDFMSEHFPFTEFVVANALGVIVHTADALQALAPLVRLPIFRLALPYASRPPTPARKLSSGARKIQLVTFGYLSPNRRQHEFLQALALMPERNSFALRIVGDTGHAGQLETLQTTVHELGLERLVTIHGFVEENELDQILATADLAINLRYPSMGEGSGSQLRIWDHALPSLVTRTEGYAEMLDNVVYFVRPDHEGEDIRAHLRSLIADPESFRQTGRNGKSLLEREHAPALYLQGLQQIVGNIEAMRTGWTRRSLADSIGAKLGNLGVHGKVPLGREAFYTDTIAGLLQ